MVGAGNQVPDVRGEVPGTACQGCRLLANRPTAHTPPHRLSAVPSEKMNLSADFENRNSQRAGRAKSSAEFIPSGQGASLTKATQTMSSEDNSSPRFLAFLRIAGLLGRTLADHSVQGQDIQHQLADGMVVVLAADVRLKRHAAVG